MLKTSESIESTTRPKESVCGVGGDNRAGCDGNKLDESKLDGSEIDGSEVKGGEFDNEIGKKSQKTFKSKNLFKSKKLSKFKKTLGLDFLTPETRLAFTKLRQAFVKAPIFYHFDLEHHIRVKTDVLGYAIGGVLNQLTSDNLGQWHPVAFFSQIMILAETRYETHDNELLTIVETFKT